MQKLSDVGTALSRSVLLWVVLGMGSAQAQTAAQLQMLANLPDSQKQALMQRLGVTASGSRETLEEAPPPVVREPSAADRQPANDARSTQPGSSDTDTLKPFGYELFRGQPTTFAPVGDVPVPSDYNLGPGDELNLRLIGKESGEVLLVVDRSGEVSLPDLGGLAVAGLRFSEARQLIRERVEDSKLGVTAQVSMGGLRNIRVFVAGDARNPGSYTVSALSTMIQALYVSGGIDEIGSLRNVQLLRNGETVAVLDLYNLLLRGDASQDARLQAGDVVFIPPVGKTVGIDGAVRRPAIYELTSESAIRDVVALAGGVQPGAVIDRVTVERIENGRRTFVPSGKAGVRSTVPVRSGDRIRIRGPVEADVDGVAVFGTAQWPGTYAATAKTRFSDVISGPEDVKPETDLEFALILRRDRDGEGLRAVYVNPRRAFAGQDVHNPRLLPGDAVYVLSSRVAIEPEETDGRQAAKAANNAPRESNAADDDGAGLAPDEQELAKQTGLAAEDLENDLSESSGDDSRERSSRQTQMRQLVQRIRGLATIDYPADVIDVVGSVRFPGELPLDRAQNSVADVLRAAGGLLEDADSGFVEITRAPVRADDAARASRVIVRVDSASVGTVKVWPGDTVAVRQMPGMKDRRRVNILGEVLYPGSYTVTKGTTLAQLVERAGGLLDTGFARGAVFTREDLQRKEESQVERLQERLRGDIAAAVLTKASSSPTAAAGLETLRNLFDELAQYQALGRLVIDLGEQLHGEGLPITLDDGDTLIIPRQPEEITVVGEVQFPTSHRWEQGKRRDAYLRQSGGLTAQADGRHVFVVRADGSVDTQGNGWFARSPELLPGDVIVVPLDATPIEPLNLFGSVTQIIYQLALTVAAFNSVGA
ncbi:MAG: SLBB domain-containing protein, partial [Oceanococcaceae bacterium]